MKRFFKTDMQGFLCVILLLSAVIGAICFRSVFLFLALYFPGYLFGWLYRKKQRK